MSWTNSVGNIKPTWGNRNMHPARKKGGGDNQGRRMHVWKGQEDRRTLRCSTELWAQGAFTWVVWMWAFVCKSRSIEVDERLTTSAGKDPTAQTLRGVTYSVAAWSDSLRGDACAASSERHVGVGWRTRHGFGACTSEARHPEEPSPTRWGSASESAQRNVLT